MICYSLQMWSNKAPFLVDCVATVALSEEHVSARLSFFVEVLYNYPCNLYFLFKAFTVDCHSGNSDRVLQYIVRDVWWPHNKSFLKINLRERIQNQKEEGQEERRKVWFLETQNSCFGIPTNGFGFIIQIYDCIVGIPKHEFWVSKNQTFLLSSCPSSFWFCILSLKLIFKKLLLCGHQTSLTIYWRTRSLLPLWQSTVKALKRK